MKEQRMGRGWQMGLGSHDTGEVTKVGRQVRASAQRPLGDRGIRTGGHLKRRREEQDRT